MSFIRSRCSTFLTLSFVVGAFFARAATANPNQSIRLPLSPETGAAIRFKQDDTSLAFTINQRVQDCGSFSFSLQGNTNSGMAALVSEGRAAPGFEAGLRIFFDNYVKKAEDMIVSDERVRICDVYGIISLDHEYFDGSEEGKLRDYVAGDFSGSRRIQVEYCRKRYEKSSVKEAFTCTCSMGLRAVLEESFLEESMTTRSAAGVTRFIASSPVAGGSDSQLLLRGGFIVTAGVQQTKFVEADALAEGTETYTAVPLYLGLQGEMNIDWFTMGLGLGGGGDFDPDKQSVCTVERSGAGDGFTETRSCEEAAVGRPDVDYGAEAALSFLFTPAWRFPGDIGVGYLTSGRLRVNDFDDFDEKAKLELVFPLFIENLSLQRAGYRFGVQPTLDVSFEGEDPAFGVELFAAAKLGFVTK